MRRMALLLVALFSVILMAPPHRAAAITIDHTAWTSGWDNGKWCYWYYGVQDTNLNGEEYFGWLGAQGSFYWQSSGSSPTSDAQNHSNACLSMKLRPSLYGTSWVQTGVWRRSTGSTARYYESMLEGYQGLHWGPTTPVPYAHFVVVRSTGITSAGMKQWLAHIDGTSMYFWQWGGTGKATAQNEVEQVGGNYVPTPATVYFGTNQAGYHTVDYALRLQNGAYDWELWDQSVTAGTTEAHDWPTVVNYSPGYPYYYFGSWD